MQGKKLLHKFIQESACVHKKVIETLTIACEGLLKAKKLSVTAIGRSIDSKTTDKHNIKRIDRLVSNPSLDGHREKF